MLLTVVECCQQLSRAYPVKLKFRTRWWLNSLFSVPQPLAPTVTLLTMNLTIFGTSYKWNHTVFVCDWLISLSLMSQGWTCFFKCAFTERRSQFKGTLPLVPSLLTGIPYKQEIILSCYLRLEFLKMGCTCMLKCWITGWSERVGLVEVGKS